MRALILAVALSALAASAAFPVVAPFGAVPSGQCVTDTECETAFGPGDWFASDLAAALTE